MAGTLRQSTMELWLAHTHTLSHFSVSLSLSAGVKMSVLESCEDEKSVAAICYLLSLLMPRSAPPTQSPISHCSLLQSAN